MKGLPLFASRAALLGMLAALLLGCSQPGGSARECAYDAPLRFSEATIRAMQPDERRELLTHNRQTEAVCSHS